MLPALAAANEALERAIGPATVVFGHNDLNPQNIMDDGERLWFVDWEFGGFVVDLFDLGVLAMNIEIRPTRSTPTSRPTSRRRPRTSCATASPPRPSPPRCARPPGASSPR